ncbi:MAG TPA: hypothetical protein VK935_01805 [Actinomycetospora sp.]|nr:hypothetical protein [Actinomycetospora sp.]
MGIGGWIVVGCACWFAVSCGLGPVVAKLMVVLGEHPSPDRVAEVHGRQRSGGAT